MPDASRPIILRRMLRSLTGSLPVSLEDIREHLEEDQLVPLTSGKGRVARDRTIRNYLALLRTQCTAILGPRCTWLQGTGEDLGHPEFGKGPFYRLKLRDAVPLIDAQGAVVDSSEADALVLSAKLLEIPGGGPFAAAMARIATRLNAPDVAIHGVAGVSLDTGSRAEVVAEILRVLHRNGGQTGERASFRRWLSLTRGARTDLVWPVLLHPAWIPPVPGWRLLTWGDRGWDDVVIADIDRAQAGPTLDQSGEAVPRDLTNEAAFRLAAAFGGSCAGRLQKLELRVPGTERALSRMTWGAQQQVQRDGDALRIEFVSSDPEAVKVWIRTLPGVSLRERGSPT